MSNDRDENTMSTYDNLETGQNDNDMLTKVTGKVNLKLKL